MKHELEYYNKENIIKPAEAFELAKTGELQRASATDYRRNITYNPYYLEPENDSAVTSLSGAISDAITLTNVGFREGDKLFISTSGYVLEREPRDERELRSRDLHTEIELDDAGYGLGALGVVDFEQGRTGNYFGFYRSLALKCDLFPLTNIDLFSEPRNMRFSDIEDPSLKNLRELFSAKFERIRNHKTEATVATLGSGAALLFYYEALNDLGPISTPGMIVAALATASAVFKPYKRYAGIDVDFAYAQKAHEWYREQLQQVQDSQAQIS